MATFSWRDSLCLIVPGGQVPKEIGTPWNNPTLKEAHRLWPITWTVAESQLVTNIGHKAMMTYGCNERCQLLPTLLYFEPAVASRWHSRAALCRLHRNSSFVRWSVSEWSSEQPPSWGKGKNDAQGDPESFVLNLWTRFTIFYFYICQTRKASLLFRRTQYSIVTKSKFFYAFLFAGSQ